LRCPDICKDSVMKIKYLLIAWLILAFPESCNTMTTGDGDPEAIETRRSNTSGEPCDGSDTIFITPSKTTELSMVVEETSGLIFWDDLLWTHNDDSDIRLYGIDTASGQIRKTHILWKVENYDWEDIAQDPDHIYVGDFGNNGGNRDDLHILRVDKNSLKSGKPRIDTIWFTYSDQDNFEPAELNQTEFDCEAFAVTADSIYLFTKQWLSANTTVYALPKDPGAYVAEKRTTFDIGGLVTGATYLEEDGLLALCGYQGLMQPFLCVFYGYPEHQFFSGKRQRFNLSILFHQVEGVATSDGLKYYISNEYSGIGSAMQNYQKLHEFDLGPYLKECLDAK